MLLHDSDRNLCGRSLTSDASLEQDLRRGGASYIDKNIACDGNLVTARSLDDMPAFNRELTRVLAELRGHSSEMRKIA
jgi:protease I